MISITDNYFDFHRSHNKPVMVDKLDILKKVMDDKLMEHKFNSKFNTLPEAVTKLNNIDFDEQEQPTDAQI